MLLRNGKIINKIKNQKPNIERTTEEQEVALILLSMKHSKDNQKPEKITILNLNG